MRKSSGTQTKVRAGKVWDSGNSKVTAGIYRSGLVRFRNPRFESQQRMSLADFYAKHTFIPQTKLEWLAVNVNEWSPSMSRKAFMARGGCNTVIYSDADNGVGYPQARFTRDQWQNMRYYLGLDEKPHCKLIDGEWVKQ